LLDLHWASIGVGLICAMIARSARTYRTLPKLIDARVADLAERAQR
jgi:hypothetical protein